MQIMVPQEMHVLPVHVYSSPPCVYSTCQEGIRSHPVGKVAEEHVPLFTQEAQHYYNHEHERGKEESGREGRRVERRGGGWEGRKEGGRGT